MGTRSLTKFINENDKVVACVYRQYDGYPSGHGKDIEDCLGSRELVNSYSKPATQVNGIGCAAAMLVAAIKDGCGNVYLFPTDAENQEYTYTVYGVGSALHVKVEAYDVLLYAGPILGMPEAAEKALESLDD